MNSVRWVAVTMLVSVMIMGAQAAESLKPPSELVGLWKAKRRFGPDAHGPLVIQREGSTYTADILGRRVPMRLDAGEFQFELPDRLGRFRGKLEGRNILGHWAKARPF